MTGYKPLFIIPVLLCFLTDTENFDNLNKNFMRRILVD
jgi:hypothetical protein